MVRLGDLLTLAMANVAMAQNSVTCEDTAPQGWDCPANLGCSTEACFANNWQDWVSATNLFRCMHDVPAVTWSDAIAQDTERHFAGQTNLTHSASYQLPAPLGPSGENLYLGTSQPSPLEVVRLWYKEVEHCALLPDGCQGTTDKVTGHFTSMVWAGDENIGCAINTAHLAVCRYKGSDKLTCKTPNMAGGFPNNVFAPSKSLAECQAKLQTCGMTAPTFAPNSWEQGYVSPDASTTAAPEPEGAPQPGEAATLAPSSFTLAATPQPEAAPQPQAAPATETLGADGTPPLATAAIPGESMPANEAQANAVGQLSAMNTFSGLWSRSTIRFKQDNSLVSFAFGAVAASAVVGAVAWARRTRQVAPLASQAAEAAEE